MKLNIVEIAIWSYGVAFVCFLIVPCTEDDVRLNGYIVQVCHNSQWGFVCASVTSWNFFATRVVCKQIGMPSTGQYCSALCRMW